MLELQEVLGSSSNETMTVKRLTFNTTSDAEWRNISEPLMKRKQESLVLVAIEKLMCARAKVFFGSPVSTFSNDIARMRHGLQTASCHDTTICKGEKEWRRNRGL